MYAAECGYVGDMMLFKLTSRLNLMQIRSFSLLHMLGLCFSFNVIYSHKCRLFLSVSTSSWSSGFQFKDYLSTSFRFGVRVVYMEKFHALSILEEQIRLIEDAQFLSRVHENNSSFAV